MPESVPPAASPSDEERPPPSEVERPPVVELRNVTVWRGEARALDGVTLSIRAGEATAILGPNGAGKTTLLRLLSRELHPERRPDSDLRLFGISTWDVWELRARLGIVSHDLQATYGPRFTGHQVVLSGFRATPGIWFHQRYSEEEVARARTVLAGLGLQALADRPYGTLSTGERRRFLLARALVHDPEVLVLDEPTSGLDLQAAFAYLATIRSLMREGRTVLLVTHHIHEIPPEVRRVVLLRRGRIVGDGPPEAMLTGPRLSDLFDTPVEVVSANGFHQAVPGGG